MLSFRTHGGASFTYEAEFSKAHYANISFFDRNLEDILFHLSLRGETGHVVTNSRAGDTWQAETFHEMALHETGNSVEVHFAEDGVTVQINGADFHLDRARLGDLERIDLVEFTGGIPEQSVVIDGPANADREGQGEVGLVLPMTIEGWACDPGLIEQTIAIDIPGLDMPPAPEIFARPNVAHRINAPTDNIGVRATLPGRIWQGRAGSSPVTVQLLSNNIPCGAPLTIAPSDIVRQIEQIVGQEERDLFSMLLAIEHVRYAGLMPLLSKTAREALTSLAAERGLTAFLTSAEPAADERPETDETDPTETPTVRVAPEMLLAQQARARFTETMRANPETDPAQALAEHVATHHVLSPEGRRALYLSLSEYFCLRDDFETLYTRAAADGVAHFEAAESAWHNSSILPFLYMQNRIEDIRRLLWRLNTELTGWVITPAVAWVVRTLITDGPLAVGEKAREDILHAFISFIDKRSDTYWERVGCTKLTETTIALLTHADRFADYMQRDLVAFALRNYGVSHLFWDLVDAALAAGTLQPEPRLAAGRAAFAAIVRRVETGAGDIEADLAFFEAAGTKQITRFRIELLGPTGIEPKPGHTVFDTLTLTGRSQGEAALRALAAPGFSDGDPELVTAAASAMAARYDTLPRAPYHQLQIATSRRAMACLARLAETPDATQDVMSELSVLSRDLATLASQRSAFVGFGIGLSLLNSLIRLGAEEAATAMLGSLGAIRAALPPDESESVRDAPALRMALRALRRTERMVEGPFAGAALELFPRASQALSAADKAERSTEIGLDWAEASPFFDTIVVVFSCQANLDTRIAAMREGWLAQLAEIGVPYIVVVGNGDGRRDGDVVYLDAPDDYEGLPLKTLATVDWVTRNTPFTHMLKIDDDCFLNVDQFFHSHSYRKFDYYGRRLTLVAGQMDRSWHFGKSTSPRGRLELDKSPEPARYADGGSGYALSRRAMHMLLQQAATPEGRRLVQNSFMEDKLVGDLLAQAKIEVSEEDHFVAVRRRSHAEGLAVSRWVNGFDASAAAPTKVVHLDTHHAQKEAVEKLTAPTLTPKKIWPSYSPVKLVSETNALELVSSEARLAEVNGSDIAVVACMRNEMFMLPHFLAHYRKLGITGFLIADNCSDDGTLEYLAEQPDVAVFSVDTDYRLSQYGVAWQQAILSNLRVGRWSLVADADELLVWQKEQTESLPALLQSADFAACDAARIFMLDMYPQGSLEEAGFASGDPFAEAGYVDAKAFLTTSSGLGPFSNQPTWSSGLRHRLIPGSRPELFVAQKIALLKYKPWMRLSAGLHYAADVQLSDQALVFAHFKYNAEFRAKAQAEVQRRQHFNNAEEYKKYLALLSEGRDRIYDPALSVPWFENETVKRLLRA
ncbi:glycosyltransferase family 2 protein [Thalassococcus sp. S3]|uniref:glycosyltransferase family 2 protein n=1 Tax=Thalassococcus sp. S3 TaxID=2017482 RepID=UPI0010248BA2|nr:glycosyltransferase family 2 protein [Thalassococcus sp. S3]QBF34247.1 hypothetical protein CFI11_23975 [Thalassococcus sp. S3]